MQASIRTVVVACALLAAACGPPADQAVAPTAATTTVPASSQPPPTTPTSTTSTVPATVPPTEPSTVPPTSTTEPAVAALTQGSEGPEVAALQRRLTDLRYWMGDAEGAFDTTTRHAVTAFQKRSGLDPDGAAGPLTLAALAVADVPVPQSSGGHVLEVDLSTQTLLLVDEGQVQWIFDTSTGSRAGTTPVGQFEVYRQVDGYDHSPLGVLYRPKYFTGGVAVHGYPSVPSYPASHGCVRVLNAAMDWLWDTDSLPIGTSVWVY